MEAIGHLCAMRKGCIYNVCSIFMCQYGEGGNLGACMYSVLLDGRICVGSE